MENAFDPALASVYHYITGASIQKSVEDSKQFDKYLLNLLYCVDFSYFLPVIDADTNLKRREEEIKYVVGFKLDLALFKKIVKSEKLILDFEPAFKKKIKNAIAVCISASYGDKMPHYVTAIGKNDRVFNTPEELAESAEKFISAVNTLYSGLVLPTEEEKRAR